MLFVIKFMCYSVSVTRRGWLNKNNVINAQNLSELTKMIRRPQKLEKSD